MRGVIPQLFAYLLWFGILLLSACAMNPPVQEMSDARQAIRAAIDADAERLSPQSLREAEQLIDQAARELESGAYEQARESATAAKSKAVSARDHAMESSGRRSD